MARTSRYLFGAASLSLLLLTSCGSKKTDPTPSTGSAAGNGSSASGSNGKAGVSRPPAKPLKVTFKPGSSDISADGVVEGGPETIEATAFEGKYHLTLSKFTKGDSWKAGDASGDIKSDIYDLVDVDLGDKLATALVKDLKKIAPAVPLHLELADGRTGDVTLPPIDFGYTLKDKLKKAQDGKLLFATKEPDDPAPKDCLAYDDGLELKTYGKCGGGHVYEIDWIAVQQKGDEKGKKVCTGYTKNDGSPGRDLNLILREWIIAIYDRRTGDVVEKHPIPPDPECPSFTYRAANEDSQDSSISSEAVEAYLRQKMGR